MKPMKYSFFIVILSFLLSCSKGKNKISIPIISTNPVTDILAESAKSGGNISDDGGSAIISRGLVWSQLQNPTIELQTKSSNGTGTGAFISEITRLSKNTTYYARAYATNSAGTSYGNQVIFKTLDIDLLNGLIAYFPFNGNVIDSSINQNNGLVFGASLSSDRFGNNNSAYFFNGTTNYIGIPSSQSLSSLSQSISVSFWFKPNSGGNRGSIVDRDICGVSSKDWSILWEDSKIKIRTSINRDALLSSNNILTLNEWHHVVFIRDFQNSKVFLHIDGVLNGTFDLESLQFSNTEIPIFFGDSPCYPSNAPNYGGLIDEVYIYKRILTSDEVTYLGNR
jgi:hypothetical protein